MSASPAELEAIRLSLWVALWAVAAALPPAIGVAWALARWRFPGRTLLETAVHLPLVLPPVATGYLLLVTFGARGWIGRHLEAWLGLRLVFDWKGAALASAVVAFPLMVRSIRVAFAMIDRRLEEAAASLGARPLDAFFTVSLPLARHGVIGGCALGFARSLGEFGATIMLAGSIPGETRTLPLYLFQLAHTPGHEAAAGRVVALSAALAAAALLVSNALERRAPQAEPR